MIIYTYVITHTYMLNHEADALDVESSAQHRANRS